MRLSSILALVLALGQCLQSASASELRKPHSKIAIQADGPAPSAKIAVIDTQEFLNPKSGVKKLIAAYEVIAKEFQPRRDELKTLQDKYTKLADEIQAKRLTIS